MRLTLPAAFIVVVASVCAAQPAHTDQARDTPDFRVQTWGYIAADFSARVWDYASLRSELEKGLRPLTVTHDSAEIRRTARALTKKIQLPRCVERHCDER